MENENLVMHIKQTGDSGSLSEVWERVRKLIYRIANQYYTALKESPHELKYVSDFI